MRALAFDGSRVSVREQAPPEPDDDMALVRVTLAGICNTDLEIARGYMEFRGVLGHEFVGSVEHGPDGWRGAQVVGEINFACGDCASCLADLARHCPRRRVMGILDADGAFAEYVAVPISNLHRLPEGLALEDAVFTEPLAAAFEILDQVPLEAGQRCVVIGDGKLGLLIAQVLQQAGGRVLAVGRHETKLGILRERGFETTSFADWQGEDRADLVVEASGSPDALACAIRATRPRGTLVLKSTVAETANLDLAPLVIDEIHLVGSRCGRFEPALQALAEGRIDVAPLVSERFTLAKGVDAFARAATSGTLKVLLDCS